MTANTAERAIRFAMEDAGLLAKGDDPDSEAFASNLDRLNDLINVWQTQGIKLWLQLDQSVTLVAGQETYTFGPGGDIDMTRPLRVVDQGYYLDADSNRRPITPISRNEYNTLANVTQQGPINNYYVDKQRTEMVVKFWMTPDTQAATGIAHLILQQQVSNVVSLTDEMDFPNEWFMALRWGLADEICTGQPSAIVQRCAQRAMTFKTLLEDWDVEDASTSIQPDQRAVLVYRTR